MSRSGLTYGLDARPPLPALLLCGLQHVAVITVIGMVFPLLVAERAGADAATRETVMGISMIAMAAGTVLQCFRWGPIGSGFPLGRACRVAMAVRISLFLSAWPPNSSPTAMTVPFAWRRPPFPEAVRGWLRGPRVDEESQLAYDEPWTGPASSRR